MGVCCTHSRFRSLSKAVGPSHNYGQVQERYGFIAAPCSTWGQDTIWCSFHPISQLEGVNQFSRPVDPLRPRGRQHARPPCPSPTPELAQTHVHWIGDAVQPSHPLSLPSPPAFSLSQHQSLFQWVSSLHQVAKILELQHQSFQWILRVDFL